MNPFTIPNLPTDNLYKFYSISGIIIILFTLFFGTIFLNNIYEKSQKITDSVKVLQLESEFLVDDYKSFIIQIDNLEKEFNKYTFEKDSAFNKTKNLENTIERLKTDSNYREYSEFFYKHYDDLVPENKKATELFNLNEKIILNQRKHQMKSLELKLKNDQVISTLNDFYIFLGLAISLLINGFFLAIKGFRLWKSNVQDLIDKKLKIELLLLEYEAKNILDK